MRKFLLLILILLLSLSAGVRLLLVQPMTDDEQEIYILACWLVNQRSSLQDRVACPSTWIMFEAIAALLTNLKSLDLSYSGLASIPPEIRQLTHL